MEAKEPPQIPPPNVPIDAQLPPTPPAVGNLPRVEPPKPPRRARTRPATPAPPVETAPSEPAQPSPAVQFAPLLSEADQREFTQAVDGLLSKAAANLVAIESRKPNGRQRQTIEQIRTFMAQSKAARSRDLVAAKSLAERAEILSRDLLAKMR